MTTISEPSTGPAPTTGPAADVSRRSFLGRTAVAGAGIALVGSVGSILGAAPAQARPRLPHVPRTPTGLIDVPLVPDPNGLLSLPPGFGYRIVAQSGVTRLDSGQPTPADFDGAASFPRRGGGAVVVANHEVSGREQNPVPAIPEYTYDPAAGGGTTTIEVDRSGNRVRERVSLAGTHNNCAGGVTPWGTWLTCEETEAVEGAAGAYGPLTQRHGYVFEVDPTDQAANRAPRPIKALGRFAHEAVAVDPHRGHFYLTEDAGNPHGLLYRWTPPRHFRGGKGALRQIGDTDGAFEAMRALDGATHVPDLSAATRVGTRYRVEWVSVPDRDATTVPTRSQNYAKPVTRSRKLEGMWWQDGEGCYFVASFARTSDGSVGQHDGQVWLYRPGRNTIELKLTFAYTPGDQDDDPDGPDNITVAPFGGVILAEDGDGAQHLVGALPTGDTFYLARNDVNDAEFAGPNISPDRSMMFASIQGDGSPGRPGYVFAILGPWHRFLP